MRQFLHKFKSDESLMLAYQNGDSLAFEVLYMRYKDSLFAFLYRNCQQTAVVEELAQDAWISVINHIERYQPTAKFKTYLYQIAHNKLVDHWRKCSALDINTGSDLNSTGAGDYEEQTLEAAQLKHRIQQALAQLPLEQRDVFLLREEGFSRDAIADITGASKETVKSRLRYATHQLRTLLGGVHG
jgi:RNA polymerase sigma-70 factor, ECF subfamily